MRHARSLRLQVVLIASALVAAVSIVVGVVSVVSLNDYLLGQLDTRVTGAAHRGAEIVGARLSNGRAGGTGIPGGTGHAWRTPGNPGAGSSGRAGPRRHRRCSRPIPGYGDGDLPGRRASSSAGGSRPPGRGTT